MTAIALTIAGSDSGGGAGIQADLKTFSALGVYGASVITAVTAQNTLGVTAIHDVPAEIIGAQIEAVLSDLDVRAIKIGMLSRVETIETVADRLAGTTVPIVLDPVMVATSGDRLLRADAVEAIKARLMPLAMVATPNLHEAAVLTGRPMAASEDEMEDQARLILRHGARAVLIKGGHGTGADAVDILVDPDGSDRFVAPRLITSHDHGTGCTLSSAIAAGLAKGEALAPAIAAAKTYLHAALRAADGLHVGRGHGPVHHFHHWWTP